MLCPKYMDRIYRFFLYIDIKQGPHCKAVSYPDKEQCTSQSHLLAGLVVRDVHKMEDNLRTKYKDLGEMFHDSKTIIYKNLRYRLTNNYTNKTLNQG